MDGTPIYDIKPYLTYADSHPDARSGFTDNHQWETLDIVLPEEIRAQLTDMQINSLTETLALDPRPHYQNDPDRIYGMAFDGLNIRFKVNGNTLTVIDV